MNTDIATIRKATSRFIKRPVAITHRPVGAAHRPVDMLNVLSHRPVEFHDSDYRPVGTSYRPVLWHIDR